MHQLVCRPAQAIQHSARIHQACNKRITVYCAVMPLNIQLSLGLQPAVSNKNRLVRQPSVCTQHIVTCHCFKYESAVCLPWTNVFGHTTFDLTKDRNVTSLIRHKQKHRPASLHRHYVPLTRTGAFYLFGYASISQVHCCQEKSSVWRSSQRWLLASPKLSLDHVCCHSTPHSMVSVTQFLIPTLACVRKLEKN